MVVIGRADMTCAMCYHEYMKYALLSLLTISFIVLAHSIGIFSGIFGFMFARLWWLLAFSIVLMALLILPLNQSWWVRGFAILFIVLNLFMAYATYHAT